MTRRRTQPAFDAQAARDFRAHALKLRQAGASIVKATVGDLSFEVEWPGLPSERAGAIGFTSTAEEDKYSEE